MQCMPLLSIVIPVYNAENYLRPCLDSVLSQKFTDYELILVDDGSSDASAQICEEYARREVRIKVIHQQNRGQAGARNRGIEAAQGKFIGFCDNDDLLHPDIFEILVGNIVKEEAEISACSYNEKDSEGRITHDVHRGETCCFSNVEGMREYLSRERMDIYVWTKIYDRQFLNTYGIRFEQGRNDEDFLFNYEAFLYAGKSVFTDQALYTYNVRESSECRVFYKKDLKAYLHHTLYRVYKIETVTSERYPEFLFLARRQTIRYHVMMIGRIILSDYTAAEPYFSYIMRYLRKNREQLFAERDYWGMSRLGVRLMVLFPPRLYYFYRRMLEKIRNRK